MSDPEGFPATTLGNALRAAALDVPGRTALVDGRPGAGRRWTYEQLLREAETVAHHLHGAYPPHTRALIWAPNSPEWIIVELAAALAGLVSVPLNPTFRSDEVRHALRVSGAVS